MKRSILFIFAFLILWNVNGQYRNPKRGISFGTGNPKIEDVASISGYISWAYNWGPSPSATIDEAYMNSNIDFVPMAWNGGFNETALRQYYNTHPDAKYLLGFNEPNFRYQANMKPSEAAAKWPQLEAIAAEYGLEIVGPAVNWCGECVSENGTTYTNPYDYLDDFFAACPDCKVDYIAVHNYMCYSGSLIDYLEGFKKYGKKIWLTEFACWDQATITLDMQKSLMIGALDYMDNDTMIYRYSWFIGRAAADTPDLTLFESEPGKLSELGDLYLNYMALHDTNVYSTIPGRIEAERYSAMQGIALELTSDFDGVANVGYIDAGDWLQYNIEIDEPNDYFLYLRTAGVSATNIQIFVDDTLQSTIPVSSSGGWQNWKTIKSVISLTSSKNRVKIVAPTGGFNLNWIHITMQDNHAPVCSLGDDRELTLPFNSIPLSSDVYDDNGDQLQYQWKKLSGPTCIIDDPAASDILVTNMVKGTYTFRLTVFDGFETAFDDIKVKVLDDVAVFDNDANHRLTIFPTPATNAVTVQLDGFYANASIEIYNLSGQNVGTKPVPAKESDFSFDVNTLTNGLYFVKLVQDGKVKGNTKMVILK